MVHHLENRGRILCLPGAGSRSLLLRQGFPRLSDPFRPPVVKGNVLKMEMFFRAYMHCTI